MHCPQHSRWRILLMLFTCLLWLLNAQALTLGSLSSGQLCMHASKNPNSDSTPLGPAATDWHHAHYHIDTTRAEATVKCTCDAGCTSCSDYYSGHSFTLHGHTENTTWYSDGMRFQPDFALYHDMITPPDTPPPR